MEAMDYEKLTDVPIIEHIPARPTPPSRPKIGCQCHRLVQNILVLNILANGIF